ncbi:MAG: hypothetical protein ACON4O_08430 [Lentimonas sp.]
MEFLKKNTVFCLVWLICILAAAAGIYFVFGESGKVAAAKSQISSAESQLNGLLNANPAPSQQNVEASEKNVADLNAQLKQIREDLQKGSRLTISTDGVGVSAAIQQYISDFQNRVESAVDKNGEAAAILVPENFGFGFDKYIDSGAMLEDGSKDTRSLDKQRLVLSYLVNKLIEADPTSITAVEREILEDPANEKSFKVDDAISARVPGAIDTMGFQVTFTGYTSVLRSFLNELAKFELPIVVRSIAVERPEGSTQTATTGGFNDFFGGFGGDAPSTDEPAAQQVTVVSNNESSFTVVLEFIDIILPSDEK